MIFLPFILSVYGVGEGAAGLGPGCGKQEREKSSPGAQQARGKL